MRIDKRLGALTAPTDAQRYFLSCWFNLVHEYSLDSYRVRVMNPGTMLREIQRALTFAEAKPEDKAMILDEAQQLLAADRVLTVGPFPPVMARLNALLNGDKLKLVSARGPDERMLAYTVNELQPLLDQQYIPIAFSQLEDLLITQPDQGHAPDLTVVHGITAALLSTLLDRNFSLESLYRIYAEVLVPRKPDRVYRFDRKLGLTRLLLTQPSQIFDVTFALDQITKPEEIPAALGHLAISDTPPFALHVRHAKTSYLTPLPKRRFVTIRGLSAADRRAAGLQAYDQLANVINLLRFEYEQARLQIPGQFAVLDLSRPEQGGRVYYLPRVVPNPTLALNGNDAADFVASVNELIGGSRFSDEGRDRITSAFRLYRQGRDQDTIETKLVHWWTALEYLVRGGQAGSGIGKSVESSLAPVIGLSYAPKLLIVVRNLLTDFGIGLVDANCQPLNLRALTLGQLWDVFKDPTQQAAIHAGLAAEPFLQIQVQQFLSEVATPATMLERLRKHDQRVRWQIQRLWRTRCDIVHSAGRGANHLLLCSNLEYYLKTALHGVLAALRSVPTLSGPLEYFDREAYRYDCIIKALAAGNDAEVRASFPT
ncbi:hypothetical protein [Thermomonas sp.]|uniref:hypothetical protein n=1 Tax=Thermomonas sp. TaxID=1971895 RepID=UPI00391DAAA1